MATEDRVQNIVIEARDGALAGRYCGGDTSRRAVLWLDADSPGDPAPVAALAERLSAGLHAEEVATLRVRLPDLRDPGRIVRDVRASVAWLAERGAEAIAIGACGTAASLAVELAQSSDAVRALVLIAPAGADDAVGRLGGRCPVLTIERTARDVAPATPGIGLTRVVDDPGRVVFAEGPGHDLEESMGDIAATVRAWIVGYLGAGAELSGPAPGIPRGDALYN